MAKDPAFLFYPNDWVGGTMGMSFAEKGAYMELLMMQFNRGHMTLDMIGHAVGQHWGRIEVKFRQDSEGLWYNERLEAEKELRKNYVNSRNNNRKGKNQYTKNEKKEGHMTTDMTDHMTLHMENEDVNEDVNSNKDDIGGMGEKEGKEKSDVSLNGSAQFVVPEMQKVWDKYNPNYAKDKKKDWEAMRSIADFILKQEKIKHSKKPTEKIIPAFEHIAKYVSEHDFFKKYSLLQLDRHIQSVITSIQNGQQQPSKKPTGGAVNTQSAFDAIDKHYNKT